jgi:hypothetical protein
MAKDDRDILEVLQEELDFIEKGGYGRSVRAPWKQQSAFQDSLTCINYGFAGLLGLLHSAVFPSGPSRPGRLAAMAQRHSRWRRRLVCVTSSLIQQELLG